MQSERDTSNESSGQPAEGRPDLGIPGADRDDPPGATPGREDDLPERLGERIYGGAQGIATGEPDVKPDVEVPEETM